MDPRHCKLVLAAACALLISACDDDDENQTPPPPPPPVAGDSFAITSDNRLISFDLDGDGTIATEVGLSGLADDESVLGADFRPADGQYYVLTSSANLYTLDLDSGALTAVSSLVADAGDTSEPYAGLSGTEFGVNFNPVPDRLRVVSSSGQNLRINVDTGATTTDTALTEAGVVSMVVTDGAYTNAFAEACRTRLYYLDSSGDRLLSTSDPNAGVLTAVGSLGLDSGAINALEIATAADGSNTAYAVMTVDGMATLHTVDLATGAATAIAPLALDSGVEVRAVGLALTDTSPPQAPGELAGLGVSGQLVSFNRGAPGKLCTSAAVDGLAEGETLIGIDVRPADGQLYAASASGGIYTLDLASGVATAVATLAADPTDVSDPFAGLSGTEFGVDFNPAADRLRIVSDSGQNLRINVDSGATLTDGALSLDGDSVDGITAAAYTNSFGGGSATAQTTQLYYLDSSTDTLLSTTAPNDGFLITIGALGADIDAVNGFDIDGRNGTALIAVQAAGSTSTTLHTLDLVSGTASAALGTVGGGESLRGLTLVDTATAVAYGVTAEGVLLSFAPGIPGTLTEVGPITGLADGETLVGLDVRPASGALYGLGSLGTVYLIDPASAEASSPVALSADPADTLDPYQMLTGSSFGADFNPVPDRLRVVGDDAQNLRINVDTGAAITDSVLLGAGTSFAAAYRNSYSGALTTALYVLDADADQLVRIGDDPAVGGDCPVAVGNPNCGVATAVGALGIDVAASGGFDIAGGKDGLVLGALESAGSSSLYRIDLTTGTASLIGTIGDGSRSVQAFAIRLE